MTVRYRNAFSYLLAIYSWLHLCGPDTVSVRFETHRHESVNRTKFDGLCSHITQIHQPYDPLSPCDGATTMHSATITSVRLLSVLHISLS